MTNLKASREVIRIAGAGPSGLAAAAILARQGFAVEVHEAKSGVGARWRRGLQVIENFTEKEDVLGLFRRWGIETNFSARPVREITLFDGRGERASFKSAEPLGYYVKRGAFESALDRGLLDQARAAGADVIFNSRLGPRDGARIVATGPRRVDGIGKEVTFATPLSDRMVVVLDPKLAPGGYAYLFVVDGEATLGMAVLKGFSEIDAYYDKTLAFFEKDQQIDASGGEASYLYANFFLNRSLERDGLIFAGEAAGFQDYLFGFGIRFAVQSGVLAARSIAEGVSYDGLWKASLDKKRRTSLWNRFLYEKCGNWLPSLFIRLARRSPNFRDYMRSWYRHDPLKMAGAAVSAGIWRKRRIFLEPSLGQAAPEAAEPVQSHA